MTSQLDMKAALPTDLAAIDGLNFTRRQESWVAESGGYFYKIIRRHNEPLQDLYDPECIETARREYSDMQFLHGLSEKVCRPERVEHGCIVYPYLSGPDMRAALQSNPADAQRRTCLREAMSLLAQLHAPAARTGDYPLKDYQRDSHLVPDFDIRERISARNKTLVISGFEVRNLRFDRTRGTWFFFDPHHVKQGVPEEDFARFVISLLMINWGRDGALRCWSAFSMEELLAMYERASSTTLDKVLLNHFLRQTVVMRKAYAMRALRAMHPAQRIIGWPYLMMYFQQIEKWNLAHAFRL